MTYLLAQLSTGKTHLRNVLFLEEEVLVCPDLSNPVDYDPSYKLEDEEMFRLNNFSTLGFGNVVTDAGGAGINPANLIQIVPNDYPNIQYLCELKKDVVCFQKTLPSWLARKTILSIDDGPKLLQSDKTIIVQERVDAVYEMQTDTLYFQDLSRCKALFSGIEALFKEATNGEVHSFLEDPCIQLNADYGPTKVDIPNRKRLGALIAKWNNLSTTDRGKLSTYIQQRVPELKFNGTAFEIGSNSDFKKFLWGVDERYFHADIANEDRVANSISKM